MAQFLERLLQNWQNSYPKPNELFKFLKMGQTWPLFGYYRPFLSTMTNIRQNLTLNERSRDRVVRIQTWDGRIVGSDESTEFWLPPPFR